MLTQHFCCRGPLNPSVSFLLGDREIQAFKVKCSNHEGGCSWEGELRELDKHLTECSSELHACKYATIGCKTKLTEGKLPSHEDSCATKHLKMAVEKVNSLTDQLKGMQEKVDSLTTQLKAMEVKVNSQATQLEKLEKPKTPSKPPLASAPSIVHMPPVIFKIRQPFYSKQDSPPVYSHHQGYKFYLQVKNNGNADSVYAYLMHGENDDTLNWPFRGIVTFQLLNQDVDAGHKKGEAKFLQSRPTAKNRRVDAAQGKSQDGWGVDVMVGSHDGDRLSFWRDGYIYLRVCSIEVFDNKPWLMS